MECDLIANRLTGRDLVRLWLPLCLLLLAQYGLGMNSAAPRRFDDSGFANR